MISLCVLLYCADGVVQHAYSFPDLLCVAAGDVAVVGFFSFEEVVYLVSF